MAKTQRVLSRGQLTRSLRGITAGIATMVAAVGWATTDGPARSVDPGSPRFSGPTPARFVGYVYSARGNRLQIYGDGTRHVVFIPRLRGRTHILDTARLRIRRAEASCEPVEAAPGFGEGTREGIFLASCGSNNANKLLDATTGRARPIPGTTANDGFEQIGRQWVYVPVTALDDPEIEHGMFVNWHSGERRTIDSSVCRNLDRPDLPEDPLCIGSSYGYEAPYLLDLAGGSILRLVVKNVRTGKSRVLVDDCVPSRCLSPELSAGWATWLEQPVGDSRRLDVHSYDLRSGRQRVWRIRGALRHAPGGWDPILRHTRYSAVVQFVASKRTGKDRTNARIYAMARPDLP